MAVAVAPYTNARLAVVDSTVRAVVDVTPLTADELRAQARALIAEAFRERPTIDVTPTAKFIAGRDIAADVSAQAKGEASEKRDG
jgi:hypothetical protein